MVSNESVMEEVSRTMMGGFWRDSTFEYRKLVDWALISARPAGFLTIQDMYVETRLQHSKGIWTFLGCEVGTQKKVR